MSMEPNAIKYVTVSVDYDVREELAKIANKYASTIGVRRLSMNDIMLVMLKQFKETNKL